MARHTVVTMPGDGIGNQVLPEALRILKAVKFDAEYVHADIGWACWRSRGRSPKGGRIQHIPEPVAMQQTGSDPKSH